MKVIFSIIAIVFSFTVHATDEITGSIEEYGIYSSNGNQETIISKDTAAGRSTIGDFIKVKTTNNVPVVKGMSFGIKWTATGFPNTQKVQITHLLEHPPLKANNGSVTSESRETYFYKPVNGKVSHTEGYSFKEDYELVEGLYKFSVIYKDKVIITKSFNASNN